MVNEENVFKVCDQPHPKLVQGLIQNCLAGECDKALDILNEVWHMGYSVLDIITTLFRVTKNFEQTMPEYLKLEFMKEIGLTHMRVVEGNQTHLQLAALVSRLTAIVAQS